MPSASQVTAALLGRDTRRTLVVLGVATALFLGFYGLAGIADRQGWIRETARQIHVIVLFVLVGGVGVAAYNAYWNDGLVLSWLLVFGPVFAWAWHYLVLPSPTLVVAIEWGLFSAVVIGTAGHGVGRVVRERRSPSDGQSAWVSRLLVGPTQTRSKRWWILAGALFLAAGGVVLAVGPRVPLPIDGVALRDVFYPVGLRFAFLPHRIQIYEPLPVALFVIGWTGVAAWPAFREQGLLVSWGLLFGPLFGANAVGTILANSGGGIPVIHVTVAFMVTLLYAILLGTFGYLFGSTLRRVVRSSENAQSDGEVRA